MVTYPWLELKRLESREFIVGKVTPNQQHAGVGATDLGRRARPGQDHSFTQHVGQAPSGKTSSHWNGRKRNDGRHVSVSRP